MKKIFKGLSILVASTALCGGIAMATACDSGYNGTYTGEYHYENYGQYYGMVVEVTVENNIITGVKDITNTEAAKKDYQDNNEFHVVSPGWETYSKGTENEGQEAPAYYKWTDADAKNWSDYENWLLQQYVGWSVADVLAVDVFYDGKGQPYATKGGYNAELASSGLLIANATQGSGRLMLAVQDALSNK